MNRDVLNKIYHAFIFYGVDRKDLSPTTHLRRDLEISPQMMNKILMVIQQRTGVSLVPFKRISVDTISELEAYILRGAN